MLPSEPAAVLIFDLDGTILRVNSFPLWVRHLLFGRLSGMGPRRRAALSAQTLLLLIRRKLGRMKHDELQRRLQLAWRSAVSTYTDDNFVVALLGHVRSNLQPLLDRAAAERLDTVLATAAAAEYAEELGQRLGFRDVLATKSDRAVGEPSNSGVQKQRVVSRLLRERDWQSRKLILFTDHSDDVPLMQLCNVVLWFGTQDALAKAKTACGGTVLVYGRDMDSATLHATLRSLRAITAS
jgi:phosphoserine phosphatase